MDEKLEIYLKNYIKNIENICTVLIKELNINNKNDLLNYRYANKKWEFNIGEIQFFFHGRGCVAKSETIFLDWDFGYGSRWCGINPFLFETTMEKNGIKEYDYQIIKSQCENAIIEGKMYKKYGLYYFSILENDFIKFNFPKEFDILEIEYFDKRYVFKHNKVVDRFLRKSNKVYKEIEKYYDKYTLKFILSGREIYRCFYNDICFPEKAVEIMNMLLSSN